MGEGVRLTKHRLTPTARKLRMRSTDAEKLLWRHIRSRQLEGAKFVRQFPIGGHIADFVCRDAHIIVELDGGQHGEEVDAERTRSIEAFGYRVIRFWNNDVLQNIDGVLEAVGQELRNARGR
ncbi:MAG TPA: DUF559 domain-containing protein [Sphingomicrobium sp.]|nr:DUF559 domain-containing protein [Sphingomicrobium sp.]